MSLYINISAQNVVQYIGLLDNFLLYQSIELYPDSTFKWTSEYDLSWDEFGLYELKNNELELNFYIWARLPETMTIKDSIALISQKRTTKRYRIENTVMYELDENGHKIDHIVDKSLRKRQWFNRHRFSYEFKRVN